MDPRPLILVVDDDDDLRALVERIVQRAGYDVLTAENGARAVELVAAHDPALVLLDITMPVLDGWGALERIRELSDAPVVMLTALQGEIDTVRALRSGAVDYVTKPVRSMELTARIEGHLARSTRAAAPKETRYADSFLTVDFVQRVVCVGEREISITPLEFRLLGAFVRHAGEVLTRDRIRELVWNDPNGTSPEQVKLYVRYLRSKLVAADGTVIPIETVRGSGYRYLPPAG